MSGVNVPLLRKAVEWAEAEAAKPESEREWLQQLYVLPTVEQAAAGEAPGCEEDWVRRERASFRRTDCGTCFCIAGKIQYETTGSLSYHTADKVACEALGLGDWEAGVLFSASNTIEDVRRIAEEIAGERL